MDGLFPPSKMYWRGLNYPPGHPFAGSDLLKTGTCPHWEAIRAAAVLVGEDPEVLAKQEYFCGTNWKMLSMSHDHDSNEGPICACVRIARELAMRLDSALVADETPIVINASGEVEEIIRCKPDELGAKAYAISRRVAGTTILSQWQVTLVASGKKRTTLHTACEQAKRVLDTLISGPLGAKDKAEWLAIFIDGLPSNEGCQLAPKDRPQSVIRY